MIKYPIFSYLEMGFIPKSLLYLLTPQQFWILRLFSFTLIIIIISILSYRAKNHFLGLIFLVATPWLFILSKEFNPSVLVFLFLLTINVQILPKKWGNFVIVVYLLFYFYFNKFSLTNLLEKAELLKNSLNLTSFFFQSKNMTSYLRIPKIGYFPSLFLPAFLVGLYHVIKYKKMIKKLIFPIAVSFIFFFLYPASQFIFAGVGILLIVQLIIIEGINQLFEVLKNRFVFFIIIAIYIPTSLFFFETYFRHYQIKYSHERRYAKIHLVEKLIKLANKKIITTKDEEIEKLLTIYSYHYSVPFVVYIEENSWPKIFNQCGIKGTICVLNENSVDLMKINKDDPKFTFIRNADGGKAYFLTGL